MLFTKDIYESLVLIGSDFCSNYLVRDRARSTGGSRARCQKGRLTCIKPTDWIDDFLRKWNLKVLMAQ